MGRPMFSVTAVVCKRGKTFDAEVSFKEETYNHLGESNVKYNQRLIQVGFASEDVAKARAEGVAAHIEKIISSHVDDYLKQYKEAKP